jgi:hypothetical protein
MAELTVVLDANAIETGGADESSDLKRSTTAAPLCRVAKINSERSRERQQVRTLERWLRELGNGTTLRRCSGVPSEAESIHLIATRFDGTFGPIRTRPVFLQSAIRKNSIDAQ